MPDPRPGERWERFRDRCVPEVIRDGTAEDSDQAVAVCRSMFDQAREAEVLLYRLRSGGSDPG